MTARTAILGWGSLLWDDRPQVEKFDSLHEDWRHGGPTLKLEFSRVSASRANALTLVIDPEHGADTVVDYAMSTRAWWQDAAKDLARRENTNVEKVGVVTAAGTARGKHHRAVAAWLSTLGLDAAVWTGLDSNFDEHRGVDFSIPAALGHLRELDAAGQAKPWFERASATAGGND